MKILMIHNSLGISGANTYLATITETLRQSGHSVHWLIIGREPVVRTADAHVTIIPLRVTSRWRWFFTNTIFDVSLYRKIRAVISDFSPHVIHIHNVPDATVTILLACRGYRTVQTLHDFGLVHPTAVLTSEQVDFVYPPNTKRLRFYHRAGLPWPTILLDNGLFGYRWLARRIVKTFLCPSAALARECRRVGIASTAVLPYCIARAVSTPDARVSELLFTGRLVKSKGIDFMLDAFLQVARSVPTLTLSIVGDGPDARHFTSHRAVAELGDRIRFAGALSSDEVALYYRRALAVVIPSMGIDNSPLVAYEAMAHGAPIIATNVGGLPELVDDGVNGYLVTRGDVLALADRMIKLATDPAFAQRLGSAGQDRLERYSPDQHIAQLLLFYV